MKILKEFAIIAGVSCLGEVLHGLIPLPVPGSIYGLVILFVCMLTKVIPYESVKDTAHFLISIMTVMFIPALVGLRDRMTEYAGLILPYLVIALVSTLVVLFVSGRITQALMKRGGQKEERP